MGPNPSSKLKLVWLLNMAKEISQIFDLTGKTALVTGASAGLGKRFAQVLSAAGASVFITARRIDKLRELSEQINMNDGGKCEAVELDVRDRASIRACIEFIEERQPIQVLINNAGIAIVKSPEKYLDSDWDAIYETNLRAPWTLAQEVIKKRLADQRSCSIVNIASVLGVRPIGHLAAYAAAKAGVINMGRDLCVDVGSKNIRINALAPGYFETEMNKDWLKSSAGRKLLENIPAGRFGQPEDLDGALLFMASDASSFMNGNLITVDGGHSAGL